MRLRRLLARSLAFHARQHLGVVLGAAIATAVLVGALAVGDSLQSSLRARALARLGGIVAAYHGHDRFFGADPGGPAVAAGRQPAQGDPLFANVLDLPGLVARQDGSARANRIRVLGVDPAFTLLAPARPTNDLPADGVWLNAPLAAQLKAAPGDELVFRLHKPGALSLDAVVSPRDDASIALRLRVDGIVGDESLGGLDLAVGHEPALNAFVRLDTLQAATRLQGRANVFLVGLEPAAAADPRRVDATLADLDRRLAGAATLDDLEYGVRAVPSNAAESGGEAPPPRIEFATRRIFIEEPALAAALPAAATNAGAAARPVPVATYLVNQIAAGDRFAPYSMVTAAGPPYTPADLADDEIVLNEWLAADLGASPGTRVTLVYYEADSASRLVERSNVFRVRGVVPLRGLWADRTLMPEFPGLAKAESTHDWDAGFDLVHKIREKDEEYWKRWRGTPKAFVSEAAGRRMWRNRFGELTAVRWFPAPGTDTAGEAARIADSIRSRLQPASLGMTLRPVRTEALLGASSGTAQMFGGLFIGCSLFIIAAALLLTALLFRFGLEQRASEIGMLLAVGWPPRRVRRLFLLEGAVLALVGGLPGAWLGTAYARGIVWGLNTAWSDAVAGLALRYEARPATLVAGAVAGILVAIATLLLALRQLGRRPARELLNEGAGGLLEAGRGRSVSGPLRFIPALAGLGAVGLAAFAVTLPDAQKPGAFFGAGILMLAGGVMALRRRFISPAPRPHGLSRAGFVWRAPGRQPTRSAATVTLLASATFLIAALAVFRIDARRDSRPVPVVEPGRGPDGKPAPVTRLRLRAAGPTGGFTFWGEAALPILRDLGDESGLEAYGLSARQMEGVSFVALRLRDGDDASCLNLSRAARPRIVGVDPQALAARGSFSFAAVEARAGVTNGWLALAASTGAEEVPAIADTASLQWALKKRVGDTLDITDERGRTVRLRFVGAVAQGILQGNILIDERAFSRLFPSESGHRVLLVDAPADRADAVRAALSRALEDTGLALTPTVERLERFNSVQNTYLATFQVLGGLGLLLGSLGLGIVVLRNVYERRGELAVMRAIGFDASTLRGLLLREHVTLVLLGLGLGTAAAAVAVAPLLLAGGAGVPWRTLVPTLAGVGLNGLAFTWIACRYASRGIIVDALRGE